MPDPDPERTTPEQPRGLRRELGLWDLVLLNVVAITGLRWWTSSAGGYGYAALPLWILAFLCFFLPSGLAVIDLARRYSDEGGIYVWTKRAFGDAHGFICGWCYWTNNLIYFPHLLIFTVGNLIYIMGPGMKGYEKNTTFMAAVSLVLFWVCVLMNIWGLRYGRWLNNLGAIGTWVPATLLIVLGGYALVTYGSITPAQASHWVPVFSFGTLAFFAQICFGFSGLELGSVMGGEIIEPRKNVPRAIVISGVIITLIYVLGTAALLVALPQERIGLLSGVADAIGAVQEKMGLGFLAGVSALLIALGGLGGVSSWLAGSSRIPFVAGLDRYLPEAFGRVHPRFASPYVALLATGIVSSLVIIVGFVGVDVEEAYLFLADFTIVLYFIPYLYLFASLLKLATVEAPTAGTVAGPRRSLGTLAVGVVGFVTTAVAIVLAFFPPEGTGNAWLYEAKIVGGCLLMVLLGWALYARGRRAA